MNHIINQNFIYACEKNGDILKSEVKGEQCRMEGEYESTDEGIVVETELENEIDDNTTLRLEPQETLEASYDPEEGLTFLISF
jgi:hypothetical protein